LKAGGVWRKSDSVIESNDYYAMPSIIREYENFGVQLLRNELGRLTA
jgi:hypothetical protein